MNGGGPLEAAGPLGYRCIGMSSGRYHGPTVAKHDPPPPPAPPATFHFITAVWGEAYTRLYLDTVLPTQASAGNLGSFAQRPGGDVYCIHTTRASAELIRAAPVFATIAGQISVEFSYIDDLFEGDRPKHTVVTEVHKRAIETAHAAGAAMVFLCPDAIWSDGSFARLIELAERGCRAVMMPGIRLCKETFLAAFQERFSPDASGVLTVGPRPLTALGLEHPHQITTTLFWDASALNPHMSHLYFRLSSVDGDPGAVPDIANAVSGGGFVARCFHLHPFMVWPRRSETRFHSTIDGDFVPLACPDPAAMHVVTDSDEMVVYELSDSSMNIPPRWDADERLTATAMWVRQFADPYHRRFAALPVRIHNGTADAAAMREAEAESQRVLDSVHERRRELDFLLVRLARRVVVGGITVTRPLRRRLGQSLSGAGAKGGGEGGPATGDEPIGSLGPGRPGWGVRVADRLGAAPAVRRVRRLRLTWSGPARAAWFRHRARLRAHTMQWHARARRRYWLVSAPVSQRWHRLVVRRRNVGWLRILGVRSTLRRVAGLPPRVIEPLPPEDQDQSTPSVSSAAAEGGQGGVDRLPR